MTKIEWCDGTWNPITGCTPISAGCQNCYAQRMARRLAGRFGYPETPNHFDVTFHHERFEVPYKWSNKPRKVFVCSMGDLFHDDVEMIHHFNIFKTIAELWRHTFIILTKRPKRMLSVVQRMPRCDNIWLGVTAENQQTADERIPVLLKIPAAVRFVSVEPMLGPVDLLPWLISDGWTPSYNDPDNIGCHPMVEPLNALHWIIAGPETGPGARECNPEWIADLYEQCKAAGVPFFDKRKNYLAREFPKLDKF